MPWPPLTGDWPMWLQANGTTTGANTYIGTYTITVPTITTTAATITASNTASYARHVVGNSWAMLPLWAGQYAATGEARAPLSDEQRALTMRADQDACRHDRWDLALAVCADCQVTAQQLADREATVPTAETLAATAVARQAEEDRIRAAQELAAAAMRESRDRSRREQAVARERAVTLLRRHLSEEQLAEYDATGVFHVIDASGWRRYRVHAATSGHVDEVDAQGHTLRNFCIHPVENVPVADNMLIAKLLLEHSPRRFWEVANITEETRTGRRSSTSGRVPVHYDHENEARCHLVAPIIVPAVA